jgi:protein-L-isoaspartate(D-aspartate) O-methyltransferase
MVTLRYIEIVCIFVKSSTISALNSCRRVNLTIPANVLDAFENITRANFVMDQYKKSSEMDSPLPILKGQTISAPHMVMMMLAEETAGLFPGCSVLEIGTGSGYNSALISKIIGDEGKLYTIERHAELTEFAKNNFKKENLPDNTVFLNLDGTSRIPEEKFDSIIVTASGSSIPKIYLNAMDEKGRLVIPLKIDYSEELLVCLRYNDPKMSKFVKRTDAVKNYFQLLGDFSFWKICDVRFVPLIGEGST